MRKAARASIHEKVHKLSELAGHNPNPHEAKAAKDKAQELRELLERESNRVRGVFEKYPGSGVWSIRFKDSEGIYRREKVGSKSAAIKVYHKRKTQALEGVKLPTLRKRIIPFGELVDDAVTYVEGKYARPADDVARLKVIREWFHGRGAENITSAEIRAALTKATEENKWSASTVNHHHNMISLCYRLAIESGKVRESPIHRKVRKQEENNKRVRYLSDDEEKRLRDAIRSKPEWAEHEPELDLALNTGLRRGSMYIELVWENVDLAARTLTIPQTKNGESITLPLNQNALCALAIFQSRGDRTGRVVRNLAGETLNVNAHWFPDAVRAAKIRPFRWHDCRHHFASKLRQAGVPLGHIAELLGHKGLAMTRRYAHLSISNLHEAVSRITNSTTVAPEPVVEAPEVSYVH
jgi:integrase